MEILELKMSCPVANQIKKGKLWVFLKVFQMIINKTKLETVEREIKKILANSEHNTNQLTFTDSQ